MKRLKVLKQNAWELMLWFAKWMKKAMPTETGGPRLFAFPRKTWPPKSSGM